jgi:small multidrug resistance pump
VDEPKSPGKETKLAYFYLVLAIAAEVAGTTCMKLADGFSKLVPSVLVFVFYAASLAFLVLVLKKIEISVAYAIWSGLGTALIATIGILWFKEPVSAMKLGSLALIIVGVICLNLTSEMH